MLSRVDYVAVKCKPQFYNNKNVYVKNQGITFIFYWLGYAVGTSIIIVHIYFKFQKYLHLFMVWFGYMAFNGIFNNISVISWRSVLLVEETLHGHYSYQGQRERKRKNQSNIGIAIADFKFSTCRVRPKIIPFNYCYSSYIKCVCMRIHKTNRGNMCNK